jgi:hypothetical protein
MMNGWFEMILDVAVDSCKGLLWAMLGKVSFLAGSLLNTKLNRSIWAYHNLHCINNFTGFQYHSKIFMNSLLC